MTKYSLLHFISQESCITWLLFMVHMCKMIISPVVFSIFFLILIFRIVSGVKGQEMVQNDKKKLSISAPYLRNHPWYDCHLRYAGLSINGMWSQLHVQTHASIYLGVLLLHVQNFIIWWVNHTPTLQRTHLSFCK